VLSKSLSTWVNAASAVSTICLSADNHIARSPGPCGVDEGGADSIEEPAARANARTASSTSARGADGTGAGNTTTSTRDGSATASQGATIAPASQQDSQQVRGRILSRILRGRRGSP
jgi:hypothetical protein